MQLKDLQFEYPPELVAVEPGSRFRAMKVEPFKGNPQELDKEGVLSQFQAGDVLVVNDTRVAKRRIFSEEGLEILFVKELAPDLWQVLFPAKKLRLGDQIKLPGGLSSQLEGKGLPQTLKVSERLDDSYFSAHGQLALPPYIQQARGQRKNFEQDNRWYQTDWARRSGSCAAPTASLHFDQNDLKNLKSRGVHISTLTLHVGLGTFLPIKVEDLSNHEMHSEPVTVPAETIQLCLNAQKSGNCVWALGTTVTRALESVMRDKLIKTGEGWHGATDLFIYPGYDFKLVTGLLTNFHQPESTLLALVSAFAGHKTVLDAYAWAVERRFKLFSYGDLTVWR